MTDSPNSLYQAVHGTHHNYDNAIWLLVYSDPDWALMSMTEIFGRPRDMWIERDGHEVFVRVLTRTGGGNRQAHKASHFVLVSHPWYRDDRDEVEWDSTFATYRFLIPEEVVGGVPGDWIEPEPLDLKLKQEAKLAEMEAMNPEEKKDLTDRIAAGTEVVTGGWADHVADRSASRVGAVISGNG